MNRVPARYDLPLAIVIQGFLRSCFAAREEKCVRFQYENFFQSDRQLDHVINRCVLCSCRYKAAEFASHLAQNVWGWGVAPSRGENDAPLSNWTNVMRVHDIKLRPEYEKFLKQWAQTLNVSVETLLARIVIDTTEGHLYIEKIPTHYPVTFESQRRKTQRT